MATQKTILLVLYDILQTRYRVCIYLRSIVCSNIRKGAKKFFLGEGDFTVFQARLTKIDVFYQINFQGICYLGNEISFFNVEFSLGGLNPATVQYIYVYGNIFLFFSIPCCTCVGTYCCLYT